MDNGEVRVGGTLGSNTYATSAKTVALVQLQHSENISPGRGYGGLRPLFQSVALLQSMKSTASRW